MTTLFKSALGATITAAALLGPAAPASAEVLFQGLIKITAVNAGCTGGPSAGNEYRSQFHPNVLGNSNFSALNRIYEYGGSSWALSGGSFTSTFQEVTNKSLGWSDYTPDLPSYLLITRQAPATIIATTQSITLDGRVKNPFGDIGQENCVATFKMIGFRNDQ